MNTKGLIIGALCLAIFGLLFYWGSQNFEVAEEEYFSGYKGEARTNPYFAARQYLRAMGYDARILSPLELHKQEYQQGAVLFYIGSRYSLGEQRSQQLLDWASNGGHLVIKNDYYIPVNDEDNAADKLGQKDIDYLAEAISIKSYEYDYNLERETSDKTSDENDANVESEVDTESLADEATQIGEADESGEQSDAEWEKEHLTPIKFNNEELTVDYYSDRYLSGGKADDLIGSNKYGDQLITRKYGDGLISVATSFRVYRNNRISKYDHARFLSAIAGLRAKQADIVWILSNPSMPGLWTLIYQHARPVVALSVGTLIIWMLSGLFRFGPIIRQPEPAQRQLLEHIDAAGHYQWKSAPQDLFQTTQSALHHAIIRLYPQWSLFDQSAKQKLLADELKLGLQASQLVLMNPQSVPTNQLFSAIKTLEQIRKKL